MIRHSRSGRVRFEPRPFTKQATDLTARRNNKDCPTRYRTRHFFKNSTTNEDISTKFEAGLPHCVRNVKEKNALLFKFRCSIFIGVRIIREMPGSVASGTLLQIVASSAHRSSKTGHKKEI